MQTVTNVTKDPTALPQASEELIAESKTSYNLYPDSPTHSSSQGCSNSLGSRKSSVCSISSMNSSGSSGSPGHQFQRSLSQVKLKSIHLTMTVMMTNDKTFRSNLGEKETCVFGVRLMLILFLQFSRQQAAICVGCFVCSVPVRFFHFLENVYVDMNCVKLEFFALFILFEF